ncbi:MAG: hypothetical protein K9H26_19125 [Prolixibacteraceae bacterium]|nr:hypothetical protein [Prolixibacteraceae bacterium]
MKKSIIILFFFSFLLFPSCEMIVTEVEGEDCYQGDQLAIIGYLSNYGAVVSVQKTTSPIGDNANAAFLNDAKVELLISPEDTVVSKLEKINDHIFVTPEWFIPDCKNEYFIKVSASGLETVTSFSQKPFISSTIDVVRMEINEKNYHVDDYTVYTLFGRPRSFWLTYYMENSDREIKNNRSNLLFRYKGGLYEYTDRVFQPYTMPHFYMDLGVGTGHFLEIPKVVSGSSYFLDQITTSETIEYNDSTWQVIDRVDSVLVQSIVYSSDFINFFEKMNEYLENRTDPFSIMADKLPSNMSNNIGYFGGMFISEREIALPPNKNATINYEY